MNERIKINRAMNLAEKSFRALPPKWQQRLREDLSRYDYYDPENEIESLKKTLRNSVAFRSVMKFRVTKSGDPTAWEYFSRFRMILPESGAIELEGDIEGGLKIIHNSCVINVEKAGKNLKIGPFVVVGKHRGRSPVIGSNVSISANSTVIGDIHLGDGCLIGASSFVNHDVEAYDIVGGNPAVSIKKSGENEFRPAEEKPEI